MPQNTNGSFNPWMHRRRFNTHPKLAFENNHDNSSESDGKELNAQSVARDIQEALDEVERQVEKLPKDYGDAVRRVMHRDICKRLKLYASVASKKAGKISLRFVARRA